MITIENFIWLIPGAPLAGFIINGFISFFAGHNASEGLKKFSSIISPLLVFVSFIVSIVLLLKLVALPEQERIISQNLYTWINSGTLHVDAALWVDQLSIVFILLITGVGFLIHLYSAAYMEEDLSLPRYFAYLNLFTFSMLILILADNILLLFVGWEGVGLCSYLLIGFWHKDREFATAGMKAFIVNRIGDFAFIIGFFMLFWGIFQYGGTPVVDFKSLKEIVGNLPQWYITTITILLFIGATGKSAQIPLYVWLPDAMAGPTPVSALIHAATMVTAGIYLIARLGFLFAASPVTLTLISIIAAATAFFAATIGITQFDIKKVLAYSTVSQLGYMFLAMGSGAFSAGIFHVMTHAFFKALLFLGAGSVIMATHHEQDIRKMGGLRKKIPVTFFTFLIGTLAIAGIPGLSGFFSKDEILWKVYSTPNNILPWLPHVLWFVGVVTAAITSFYMFRLLFLTFWGKYRADQHSYEQVHESPLSMTIPLVVLALLAIIGGYIGLPGVLGGTNILHHWLTPVLSESHAVLEENHHLEILLMLVSTSAALGGLAAAYFIYILKPVLAKNIASGAGWVHTLVYHKYFVDEVYGAVIIKPVLKVRYWLYSFDQKIIDAFVNFTSVVTKVISQIHGYFDRVVVDGVVNIVAMVTDYYGNSIRQWQNGSLNRYLFYILGSSLTAYILVRIF